MVKRWKVTQPGTTPGREDGIEVVPASDYDALAAKLARVEDDPDYDECCDLRRKAEARIRELEAALRGLYDGTAEYIYLNHLGDPHNTTPMRNAAKALGLPELFKYDRLAALYGSPSRPDNLSIGSSPSDKGDGK